MEVEPPQHVESTLSTVCCVFLSLSCVSNSISDLCNYGISSGTRAWTLLFQLEAVSWTTFYLLTLSFGERADRDGKCLFTPHKSPVHSLLKTQLKQDLPEFLGCQGQEAPQVCHFVLRTITPYGVQPLLALNPPMCLCVPTLQLMWMKVYVI